MTEQTKRARLIVRAILQSLIDQRGYTDREVAVRIEELAEAELTVRLSQGAAWRA